MKKIFFIVLIAFISVKGKAQLQNTQWKGTIKTDTEIDVVFNYKSDTLDVLSSADGSSIETMTYSTKDSVLSLQKIYGQSSCDGATAGTYKFMVKDKLLYITLISDSCDDRSSVLNNSKWTKIE